MEISAFLQQSATWNLRKAYLDSVQQKHADILKLLKSLSDATLTANEKKSALSTLFNEVHRLKGSGGTYGFNEISWIYKELIAFIRAANEGQRPLDSLDVQKALETANEFSGYLPLLLSSFQSTHPSDALLSGVPLSRAPQSILCVSEERPAFVAVLERFFVRKPTAFFTAQNRAEALEALKILNPGWILATRDIFESFGPEFFRELKQLENARGASLALLLKTTEDRDIAGVLEAGTRPPFFLDAPDETLLGAIESWTTSKTI